MNVTARIPTFIKTLLLRYKYRHNNERAKMINRALDFCRFTQVEGDYLEFGVFQGAMCIYTYKASRLRKLSSMRIFAFDSFAGFSAPAGSDDIGILKAGDRSCSLPHFQERLKEAGVPIEEVVTVPGFFDSTLRGKGLGDTMAKLGDTKAAIVYVDCDLYEPARDVLEFITPYLTDGTVLIFDNWFLFKGSPFRGERRALTEWSETHPRFILSQFNKFGWHGESFIVTLKEAVE